MASTTTPLSAIDLDEFGTILSVHREIVERNILSRLDGLSLTSLRCTSLNFKALSSEDSLWRRICTSTWPSLNDPRVQRLITAVPNGYRRLFSDSFPLLTPHEQPRDSVHSSLPSDLISAVDIWYQNKLLFSRVIETKTNSSEFLHSQFRVDLLDPKEVLPAARVKIGQYNDDSWLSVRELEENLTLSWIIYDPNTNMSANFSTTRPVSSERHWMPGEYDVKYATILGCEQVGYEECKIVVTCGGLEHGELQVREICMRVQNMDGKYLIGKKGLSSLMKAIEFGKRKNNFENEGKKMHEGHLRRKKVRWEKKVWKEKAFEIVCGVGGVCVVYGVVFLFYIIVRYKFVI
ncbi:hypothetical protein RND81_05G253700 [Saponaria officinalis]|uniref:F-box protein n=1 Tax=Saponaria officinalis TaxID=3572 RepID=A0AAW1L279_SAPOF